MTYPIRILHVFGKLNRGGAESMIMSLYREIDREKIQFDFVKHTDSIGSFESEIKKYGGKIYSVPKYLGKNHISYVNSWKKFFDEHPEYNIIHGHVRSTASIYLKIANRYNRITISHSHSLSSGIGIQAVVKNILQYPIRNVADNMLACTIEAGQWLFGNKVVSNDNFYILKNAIETDKYLFDENIRRTTRSSLGIKNQTVIGHVGRFHPLKNHDFLIKIYDEYYKINPNSLLLLVGDGELKEEITKKVSSYEWSENVMFLGERSDVHNLMQAFDLFLFPSLSEGLGIVVIEAQASGLPSVISDTIPKDVEISHLVKRESLNESANEWAKSISNSLIDTERGNMKDEVINAGYDVKETTKWLSSFYMRLLH